MDCASVSEICLHELKMSGVRAGERLVVLTQGNERLGPNNELSGSNDTACHRDIPMCGCSLFLDGEPVLIDGDIVVKELQFGRRNDRSRLTRL